MMLRKLLPAVLLPMMFFGKAEAQSQFYLFPVAVLEGVSKDPTARDPQSRETQNKVLNFSFVKMLQDESQRLDADLIRHFQGAIRKAFPQSTVHASQVSAAGTGGTHEYIEAPGCDARFRVPISSAYAVVLAVTRATVYQNDRAGLVDYLAPVTLTLQILKPEKGKVVYTLSDTFYSRFTFSRQEAARKEETSAKVDRAMIANMKPQIDFLVGEAAKVFNPREASVKVVGKSGKYLVLDGGYEIGFNKGDEPSAVRSDGPATELFFKVISAASGHSIVRLQQGDVEVGATLKFVFESPADDSEKPALLPVTKFEDYGEQFDDQAALAGQFIKNLGFKSRFNVTPVNTRFSTTMGFIRSQANCNIDWSKYPAAAQLKDARTDVPNFFAQFEMARSEIYRNEGTRSSQGASTESEEEFAIATAVKLVDSKMRVHYSEVAVEPYKIRRVAGSGVTTRSGIDVAIKNSALKLAENFARNAKLETRELRISKATGDKIWVPASGLNPNDITSFTVFRELDRVSVKGQKVWLPLELGDGAEPKVSLEGEDIVLSFSRITDDTPLPQRGDRIRFQGLAKPGAVNLLRCAGPDYYSDRSAYEPKFANLFIEAGINGSPKLQLVEASDDFFKTATKLLDVGNFKSDVLRKASGANWCYQAGAAVRPDAQRCEGGRCKATVVNGLVARFAPANGTPNQQVQAAQQSEVNNISESTFRDYLGFQSMLWFDGLGNELKKRLQTFTPK